MTSEVQKKINFLITAGDNDQLETFIGGIYYVLYKNQPFSEDISLADAKNILSQLLDEARKRGIDETKLNRLKTFPESEAAKDKYAASKAIYEKLKSDRLAKNKKLLLYGGIATGLILIVANRKKIITFFKELSGF